MQGEEPAACLVDTFGYEVGREQLAVVESVFILKRIVNLGIGHRTAVEPHVDEVCFAIHGLARRGHKHYVVDIGTVQIDFLVVFGRIIARHESFVGKRIRRHNAGSHSLLYLGKFSSHLPKRPEPVEAGFHLIRLLFSISSSRIAVERTNQLSSG